MSSQRPPTGPARPARPARPVEPVAPTAADPVARAGSEVLGGPAGRRLGPGAPWWARPLPVALLVAAVAVALGAVSKHRCRTAGWNTPDQFWHACYADGPVVYTSSGLAQGLGPYGDGVSLGQPPLTAALAWLLGLLAPDEVSVAAQRAYFDAMAVALALAALAVVAAVAVAAGRRRGWDALLVAASPVLVLTSLVSLDLLGVALAAAGLAAWARRRPVLAGVLVGLAAAARTWPALLLLALLVVGLRCGRARAVAGTAGVAALTWLAVSLPVALVDRAAWSAHLTTWAGERAGYGSVWLLPQLWAASAGSADAQGLPGAAVTALAVTGWVVWTLLVALFVLWLPRRPRLPQVALALVAGWCVLAPSFPVQASLWLLPLAALAVPRWRDHLLWWATEAAYFAAVWLFIAGQSVPDRALPPELYALLLLLRVAGVAWLVAAAARDARAPRRDPVRAGGADDPAGGVFDRAPDALVVRVT
ncbi:glycosyltransferase 87 family protein [Kineococcus terrestris]|uniref:glycosyltransferase 87 family protein n=1 Tax=Kineococcus terrestris TaxID=2044856 RepID=UPI0034DAF197